MLAVVEQGDDASVEALQAAAVMLEKTGRKDLLTAVKTAMILLARRSKQAERDLSGHQHQQRTASNF